MSEPLLPDPALLRTDRRRSRLRTRRRVVAGLLAAAALVTLGLTWYLAGNDHVGTVPLARQTRTQRTLLLQLQGAKGAAVSSALLAHDPASHSGAVVLVPSQVIANVPGVGAVPFGDALGTAPPQASRDAVADLLGVIVDGGWVLDLPTLSRLVDNLGGVQVVVDVPVPDPGGQTVLLPAGAQRVNGPRAAALVSYLGPGEQEQARLGRLQALLEGVLGALPKDPGAVAALVDGLGPRSQVSLPTPDLAGLLLGLAAADSTSQLQYDVLPVLPIERGDGQTSFRVDAAAAPRLVDRLLAQSVPAGSRQSGNRVLVLNGVGTPGLGEKVRARLVPSGFVYVGSRNAPRFGYPRSQVLVPDASERSQQLGAKVAAALGLPADDVATGDLGTIADVVVLVGADFAP